MPLLIWGLNWLAGPVFSKFVLREGCAEGSSTRCRGIRRSGAPRSLMRILELRSAPACSALRTYHIQESYNRLTSAALVFTTFWNPPLAPPNGAARDQTNRQSCFTWLDCSLCETCFGFTLTFSANNTISPYVVKGLHARHQ
ncbi:hypothetical protein FA15DRAFT_404447 [Coprinopsis marcescibilis]|uniref:Secreted protein n=1 Tax=Coprinopsis marcescibilis TaxID=230819 RepID=A0A5C3KWE8_COPMA|nr:hypothetical protein FA15DRAFT_404447 [Coprinopsis marcescibilis]